MSQDKSKLEKALETAPLKTQDDSLKENASAAENVGLEVRVTREYDKVGLSGGRECQWCKERECTNVTLEEAYRRGAFQRHPGCECEIEYTSAKGITTIQTRSGGRESWERKSEELTKRRRERLARLKQDQKTPEERIAWEKRGFAPTLENFDKHEKEWLETHFSYLTDSQKEFMRNQLQTVFDNGEYHMAIGEETIEAVLESGRLKSVIEVNPHDIMVSARKKVAELAYGCKEARIPSSGYEVYGYLGNGSFAGDVAEATAASTEHGYGSVILRFKKDALENRVTYTYNDSYGIVLSGDCIAGSDGKNVTIAGVDTDERRSKGILNSLMTASESDLKNPNRMAHSFGGSYIELQYHGGVTVGDIESVCFTEEIKDIRIVEKLKDRGIRVYHVRGSDVIEI